MIRSGRIRSAFLTKSRIVMAPFPSMLAGLASSVTTCGCSRRSSAASSIVTIRSSEGMKEERTFSVVVLPEPVPPLTIIFSLALTHPRRKRAISSESVPKETRFSIERGVWENLRIVMQGPISDNGGIIILTRDPSGSLASTKGDASSI